MKPNDKAREISADMQAQTGDQIEAKLLNLHTSMPAIVIDYDRETRTLSAQPAIQRVFSEGEGLSGDVNLPVCVDVPVHFPSGGGYEITFPVSAGDECLLIFSERCIDGWFETGDPTTPRDFRQHDLSDAVAIVGIRSKARSKASWGGGVEISGKNGSIRLNDNAVKLGMGSAFFSLTEDRIETNVIIRAPNVITDDYDVNEHYHEGVKEGTSQTQKGKS